MIGILEMEVILINSLYSYPLKKKNHALAMPSPLKKKKKVMALIPSPAQVPNTLTLPHLFF